MRVVLLRVLNPFFDTSASGNRYSSLIKGLQCNGVDVSVVVTGGYNTPAEKRTCDKESICHGVRITYLSTSLNHTLWRRRINTYLLSPITNMIICFKLKRIIKQKYDYLWLTNNYVILNFFNRNKDKIQNSLLEINEFHDIYKIEGNLTNKVQLSYAQKKEVVFLEAIKHIDCFAIMTNTLLDYYKKTTNPKADFLHLPMTVDMSRFDNVEGEREQDYIAFAGSFSNAKDGVDVLIKAFANIAPKFPNLSLKLAGFYHDDVNMQKIFIKESGLEDRVQYMGVIRREDVPKFLANAKILALPRPDSHQAQGGFPTKLGEYLATSNPVCVTKVGEIPDYLEDNVSAFMATPGDIDSFADAMCRALSDKENACKVGRTGYEVAAKNFNMDVQAKRLKEFLEKNIK